MPFNVNWPKATEAFADWENQVRRKWFFHKLKNKEEKEETEENSRYEEDDKEDKHCKECLGMVSLIGLHRLQLSKWKIS